MTTLFVLSYDLFIETMKGLPVRDILNTCQSDKQTNSHYQQPNFWQNLIKISFNVDLKDATREDYHYLQQIFSIKSYVNGVRYLNIGNRVVDHFRSIEIGAFVSKKPDYYYLINPGFFFHKSKSTKKEKWDDLEGVVFRSKTVEGAYLKMHQYYHDKTGNSFLQDSIHDIVVSQELDITSVEIKEISYEIIKEITNTNDSVTHFHLVTMPQLIIK